MSNTSIVAIDIGSYTIKVAEFSQDKGGALVLENFYFSDLEIDPSKEINPLPVIQDTLARVFKDNHIKHKKIAYAISGQSVFPKFIKLPPSTARKNSSRLLNMRHSKMCHFP